MEFQQQVNRGRSRCCYWCYYFYYNINYRYVIV